MPFLAVLVVFLGIIVSSPRPKLKPNIHKFIPTPKIAFRIAIGKNVLSVVVLRFAESWALCIIDLEKLCRYESEKP